MQWDIKSKSLQMSAEPEWISVVKFNASLGRKYSHGLFSVQNLSFQIFLEYLSKKTKVSSHKTAFS